MQSRYQLALLLALAFVGNAYGLPKWFHGKKHGKRSTPVTASVVSGIANCKVDVDGQGVGITSGNGTLIVKDLDPGDHYVHVQCPKQREASYFISPVAGQRTEVDARGAATNSQLADSASINPAASEMELRHMVSEADQLRSSGQFKEAIDLLRKAATLDPKNGDLHRELGITFLMFHDWDSARIEMLEAVRREPENVDAHSGLAYALEKLGDYDEALKEYKLCTQLDPHDTSYRDHYVQVLGELYAEKAQKKH